MVSKVMLVARAHWMRATYSLTSAHLVSASAMKAVAPSAVIG